MGQLIHINGSYKNKDVIENVIRYITRTRINHPEDRANELIAYGGAGVRQNSPETMIYQFEVVQKTFPSKNTSERKICHEVMTFNDRENRILMRDIPTVIHLAEIMSGYYLMEYGLQTVYGVHQGYVGGIPDRLHIHFGINTTSVLTGRKMHDYKWGTEERNRLFNLWTNTAVDNVIRKCFPEVTKAIIFY